jgi:iron complex transport system substrate-binding protein
MTKLKSVFLTTLLLTPSCKSPPPAPASAPVRAVSDALGRTVRVPLEVRRVVSLAPSSTEILYALGAGAQLVGVDKYSDWPAEARALPHVGADVDPSLERIVSLRPDVVFSATSANTQSTAETLERLGVPVYVSRADSLDAIYADIRGIGGAVGRGEAAARLVENLQSRIAAVSTKYGNTAPVPIAVVVWTDPLIVAGTHSHVGDLVRAAGGRNVADDSAQPFPTYSVERLLERAPSVVVVGTHADSAAPMAPLERLTALPAVRDHRLHRLDGDLLFRPGPRVVEGVEALARLLHPPSP